MKFHNLCLVILTILFFSCMNSTNKDSRQEVDFTSLHKKKGNKIDYQPIKGYFLKNTVDLPEEINLFWINSEEELNACFGIASVMFSKPDLIDFSKNTIVGICLLPTNYEKNIQIGNVEKMNNSLKLEVEIKAKEMQSFYQTPIQLIAIPKQTELTDLIAFVNGEENIVLKNIK